jgi:hypothetical protein
MNKLLVIFLTIVCLPATAQVFQKYQSRSECVNRELQKYPSPTQVALAAAYRFCDDLFTNIEIEKIDKKCGFKYHLAIKDGYTHAEIVAYIAESNPTCLR